MTAMPLRRRSTDAHSVSRRLAAASDERRRLVERVMHDGVQQNMALLGLKLSMLQKQIRVDAEAAEAMCDDLRKEIQGALRELRVVAHLVYPAVLDNEGLAAALHHAAQRLGVTAVIDVQEQVPLPEGLAAAFYFCCLEALDNAARHAGPGVEVRVRVRSDGSAATFEVTDSGCGFGPADIEVPSGLQHIADRVEALDGVFDIDSSELGTTLRASVPLPAGA